jgi:dUTP pyrophosphatase|tara:strand:+ start:3795 stop:4370 length:576 start_codon:yes stop_codon:yes gene_type:complete
MNVKKLSDKAVIPSKGSAGAAGYDLYTTESYELKPGERKAFKTDIALSITEGFYGRVAPRSGLAVKHGIDVLAGVIDSDYRGEILVALINLGDKPVQLPIIKDGKETAIAQIIFEGCGTVTDGFTVVDDLTATQRGSGGFGSSDNKRETIDQASKQMSKMEELYNKLGGVPTPAKKYSQVIGEREQQQFNR